IVGVFVAMKARIEWYALQCATADSVGAIGAIIVEIDRCAFWLAFVAGIASWRYIDSRGVPSVLSPGYSSELRRFFILCMAATGALITTVAADGLLTALRLIANGWYVESLVPVASMAIEIACVGVLIGYLRSMLQRTAFARRYASPQI